VSAFTSSQLREGLRARGYLEGENVIIDYRWAEDQFDRLPALAAELVRRRASVIATPAGTVAALAAKKATTTIPIIFGSENDPLKAGLVASSARETAELRSAVAKYAYSAATTCAPSPTAAATRLTEPERTMDGILGFPLTIPLARQVQTNRVRCISNASLISLSVVCPARWCAAIPRWRNVQPANTSVGLPSMPAD
jgi:hypothetical protein